MGFGGQRRVHTTGTPEVARVATEGPFQAPDPRITEVWGSGSQSVAKPCSGLDTQRQLVAARDAIQARDRHVPGAMAPYVYECYLFRNEVYNP